MAQSYPKSIIQFVLLLSFLFVSGCAPAGKKTAIGGLGGAALGAGLGAIIGSATGDAGRGVAIGAGTGALAGAALGNSMDGTDQELGAHRERLDAQRQLIEENQKIIDELRRRGADVRSTDRGVVINLPDILFEFDRSSLTPAAKTTIEEISDVVANIRDRRIAVEGHTDSIGSFEYNRRLSRARAQAVSLELQRRGVPRGQMTVDGFGEGSPIATNNTAAGRTRNRRVEIIVENR